MPTIGPYQLLHALGACQVGDVWSAVDAGNNQVTVAVLKPENASDPALRDAFATAANNLAQSRQVPIIAGDFSSATPWIAAASSDGSVVAQVFTALGMTYQPVIRSGEGAHAAGATGGEATQVVHRPPASMSPAPGPPSPTSPGSLPTHAAPGPPPPPPIPTPAGPLPVSSPPGQPPVSGPPGQVSGPPQPMPMPGWAPPLSDASPQDLTPIVVTPPDEGQRSRTGLVIGVLVAGILALGGTGGAIAFVLQPESAAPPPPSPGPVAASGTTLPSPPAPSQPGIEPPLREVWPEKFAGFGPNETREEMADLPGLSFAFAVPDGWDCVDSSTGDGVVRYTCGPGGNADEVGGELIVSGCPDPCDADTRQALRSAEEAWGKQWHGDGEHRAWIETDVEDDRYGLVLVGYTRSSFDARIDQKVVLRMTGPPEQKNQIQKVATSIRNGIRNQLIEL